MNLVSESLEERDGAETDGEPAPPGEARRLIDAAVADVQDDAGLDHRELAAALLEARDTLLVYGRVPDWFGDVDADQYGERAPN